MKKSFAVLGLGSFGLKLVEELSYHNVDVIAVDESEENVAKAGELINNTYICNVTNEAALRDIGIGNVDHVIVAIGSNIPTTILTTVILKEMNIPKITVRVDDDYYVPIIKKLGATEIVSPQKLAGNRLANKIISDTFIDYYDIGNDFCIVEISISPEVEPMNILELNPRNKYDVNILIVRRDDELFSPKGTDEILPNDIIFVFGKREKISKFDSFINNSNVKRKTPTA